MTLIKPSEDWDQMIKPSFFQFQSNNFVRFYTQQEIYLYQQKSQTKKAFLPFNRIISDTITDLLNMNNIIASNTRLSISFLENGKQISNVKEQHWDSMLKHAIFTNVNAAYQLLESQSQQILKYTVLAVTNLILKLGINMSKICMLFFQKKLTFNCLGVFSLAVSFLIYLQYELFLLKKPNIEPNEIQNTLFFRSLPKIAIIKLSYRKNTHETTLLYNAQKQFFKSKAKIKNIQFIQIYEIDDQEPNYQEEQEKDYQYIFSINIAKKLKMKAPFSFNLLFFMKHYVFHLLKDFRPDIILFVEAYPENRVAVDAEVRGLIILEIIDKITPKIYFMKQYGCEQLIYQKLCKSFKGKAGKWHNNIDKETTELFKKLEKQFYDDYEANQFQVKNTIKSAKKIMLNDFAYCSLALLQRYSFEKVIKRSRSYIHSWDFINGLGDIIKDKIQKLNALSNNDREELKANLKVSYQIGSNMMLLLKNENVKKIGIIDMINKNTSYNKVVNLKRKRKIEQLILRNGRSIYYNDNDQILVEYKKDKTYVFIFGQSTYTFLMKNDEENRFDLINEREWQYNQLLKGCAYVCSGQYLYRAFGMYTKEDSVYSNIIYRYKLPRDKNDDSQKWQFFANLANNKEQFPNKEKEKHIQIQYKHSSYGFYDEQNDRVFFMGGYIDSSNQEKIGKKVYIIQSDKQVISTAKTNNMIILEAKNIKPILYPFIFGMPFYDQRVKNRPKFMILNTNSDYFHLNNSGKLFLTEYLLQKKLPLCGIKPQCKLVVKPQYKVQTLINKQRMIDYIVLGSSQVNRYNDEVAVRVPGEGSFVFKMNSQKFSIKCEMIEAESSQISTNFELFFEEKK